MAALDPNRRRRAPIALALSAAVGHIGLLVLGLGGYVALNAARAWQSLQEGGMWSWLLLGVIVLSLAAVGVYGALAAARPRLPSWPLGLAASGLSLLGVLGVAVAMGQVDRALGSHALDPSQVAAILAAGLAASFSILVLAASGAALLWSCAAGVVGSRALGRTPGGSFGKSAVSALAAGGALLVLAVLARVVWEPLSWGLPWGLLPAANGVIGALLGAMALDGPDGEELGRARAASDVLLAGLAGAAGAVFAALVVEHTALVMAFSAIAGVAPEARSELLARAWTEAGQAFGAQLLHAAPPLGAALAALGVRPARLGRALAAAWAPALVTVVLIATPYALMRWQSRSFAERLAAMSKPAPPPAELEDAGPGGTGGHAPAAGTATLVTPPVNGPGGAGGHGPAAGTEAPSTPQVIGALPKELVRRIVRQNRGRFRYCYEQGLRAGPALAGRLTVRFVIGADGKVGKVTIDDSTLGDQAVEQCIAKAFAQLTFPKPEGGGVVAVSYPLVFSNP